jgi:hypothetical protein
MFRHTHINTNKFYMHKESLIYAQIQINNVYKAHTWMKKEIRWKKLLMSIFKMNK